MRRECFFGTSGTLTLLGVILASGLLSAAPSNDKFADSVELQGASGQIAASNVEAGVETGEPAHAGFAPERSVWWNWTTSESGRVTFLTHGSSFDTRLGLYSGERVGALTAIGSNDDVGSSVVQSLVSVWVGAGTRLHIAVDGFADAGSIVLTWYFRPESMPQPPNDKFIDRARLMGRTGRLIGTNEQASRDPQEPMHAGKPGARSVWWTWNAPENGLAVIHTGGSTFDTLLAVYTGQAMEDLVAVAEHDGEGVTSYVSLPVVEGIDYEIAVDGFRTASGVIVLSWELLGECVAPPKPFGPLPPDGTQGAGATLKLEWNWSADVVQNVIYGEDDRLDLYEVDDPALLLAAESTVALVPVDDLTDNGDGTYSIPGDRVGENTHLCDDERFVDQPNPARCTGFLVAPDLIATAGHCIKTTTDCASHAFIFGFRMNGPGDPVLTFPRSQVYFCDGILGREFEAEYDWAVVRLDRPVLDREPLRIRREGMVDSGEGVIVIGHPTGWPVKVAGGARVRESFEEAFFVANLDVYGGNSGSPVLNADTLVVEGILVGGEEDFVFDANGNCSRSKMCPDDGCLGEAVTRSTEFSALVAANPSPMVYEVYLARCDGPSPELELVGETGEQEWTMTDLEPEALYCWRVVARRECGEREGPLWSFVTGPGEPEFIRGDADGDGTRNIADAANVLNFLFSGGSPLSCEAAADVDDDGSVNVTDPVALLNFLFSDGPPIPPPTIECDIDPTPDKLTCEAFEACG